jgi:hypothetical protein
MNNVQSTTISSIPGKSKTSSKGWVSFNAVCCTYNGESQDKRMRGGIITDGDAISYHCFNCGFKTGWKPGRNISLKYRRLLQWMGVDSNSIQMLNIEALRIKDTVDIIDEEIEEFNPEFDPRDLPKNVPIDQAPQDIQEYAIKRCLPLNKCVWSDQKPGRLYRRVLIPFTWKGKEIGFTARGIDDETKPKYFTNHDPNYVYGIDDQYSDARYCIVTEGILDALCINGISTLGNACSETQAQIIDTLNREVILVPDQDKAGQSLINDALEFGWSVSFPEWEDDVKDVNDAVVRYGKLFTIKNIIDAKETSTLKINLKRKKYV